MARLQSLRTTRAVTEAWRNMPRPPEPKGHARVQLAKAISNVTAKRLAALLSENGLLKDLERYDLFVQFMELYDLRCIGKGFSAVIHNLATVLEQEPEIDGAGLERIRHVLESLYQDPEMSYVQARSLRQVLKESGLRMENLELRRMILTTVAEDIEASGDHD